jgi:hypothetical protein
MQRSDQTGYFTPVFSWRRNKQSKKVKSDISKLVKSLKNLIGKG